MPRRVPLLLALAPVWLCLAPAALSAPADGDPAADVLMTRQIYTPVAQRVTPTVLGRVERTIRAARAAGFRVRVALILKRSDSGFPGLFERPGAYARVLAREVSQRWKGAVIVVQPSGVGVANAMPRAAAQGIAARITMARPATSDNLARAAIIAIRAVATTSGHPIT